MSKLKTKPAEGAPRTSTPKGRQRAVPGKPLMSKSTVSESQESSQETKASPTGAELSDEDKSKDRFFVRLAEIAEAMIARHGKDFAIGTLILSARFVAEDRPLINRGDGSSAAATPPTV